MKKSVGILAVLVLFVCFGAAKSSWSQESKNPWQGVGSFSIVSDYVVKGVPFVEHNKPTYSASLWLGDTKGTTSLCSYYAGAEGYGEFGAEFRMKLPDLKFVRIILFPLTWKYTGLARDYALVAGGECFFSEGGMEIARVGFLGLAANNPDNNGVYYYVALAHKVLGALVEAEVGMNRHFCVPGGEGIVASVKATKRISIWGLDTDLFVQKYWIDRSINPYNEFLFGACFNFKVF